MKTAALVLLALAVALPPRCSAEGAPSLRELHRSIREQAAREGHEKALAEANRKLASALKRRDKGEQREWAYRTGRLHEEAKDFAAAQDLFSQGLELARAAGDKAATGLHLAALARVYGALGDHPGAVTHYRSALDACRGLDDKAGEAEMRRQLADGYRSMGAFDSAIEQIQSAMDIDTEGGSKTGLAQDHHALGLVAADMLEYGDALAQFKSAWELYRQVGDPSPDLEDEMAVIYETILAHFSRAGPGLAPSLNARVGIWTNERALFVPGWSHSKDRLAEGRLSLARRNFKEASTLFKKAIEEGENAKDAAYVIAGYQGLGWARKEMGDLAGSRQAFENAIATIESERELLAPAERGLFLQGRDYGFRRKEAFEGRCLVAVDAADGFYWAEHAKARAFIESVAARRGSAASIPEDLAKAETDITRRIAATQAEIDAAFYDKRASRGEALLERLAEEQRGQDDLVARLRKEHPEYAAARYPQPLRAEDIKLKPDEVLIEYMVTKEKTLAFVVTPGKDGKPVVNRFEAQMLFSEFWPTVMNYLTPFHYRRDVDKRKGTYRARYSLKLYETLLSPIFRYRDSAGNPLVTAASKLIIVPDDVLGIVPFEAFIRSWPFGDTPEFFDFKEGAAPSFQDIVFLGDLIDIAYAQSATALMIGRTLREGRGASSGMLVLADPIFSREDERAKADASLASYVTPERVRQAQASAGKFMGVKGTIEATPFARLKETGTLAANLRKTFGSGTVVLQGRDASESRLRAEDLARYRYLVFATHGILDADIPYLQEPALMLNQLGNPEDADGFLGVREVMGLKLDADVVALTACGTGLGRQVSGEGVMGLGRAFQYAGARNVLMSLWSVSEKSTTMLADAFFAGLKAGQTPRAALKAGRAKLRANGYNHPFFWAPFILMTD